MLLKDSSATTGKQLALGLRSSESYTGNFRYRGKKYRVATRSSSGSSFANIQKAIAIKFAEGREDSAFLKRWNSRPEYRSGDTAVLAKRVFRIKEVSPLLRNITLQPLNISPGRVQPKEIDQRLVNLTEGKQSSEWEGKAYPSFSIASGKTNLTSDSLKGKVTFINFWFEACPPCIAEFDALSQMHERLKDKEDFQFASITFESPQVIERVKKKYGLTFPIFSISKEECERLNVGYSYPTNVIINKKGEILFLHAGGETSREEAKRFIDNEFYTRIIRAL